MKCWAVDSLQRILPESPPGRAKRLRLAGAAGEVIAFQVGIQPGRTVWRWAADLSGSLAKYATVRLEELVPLRRRTIDTPPELQEGRAPGFVPDPLVAIDRAPAGVPHKQRLAEGVSRGLWVTIRLPRNRRRGSLKVSILEGDNYRVVDSVQAEVDIWPLRLPRLRLPVTNWFYSDALVDWYGVEPFSPRYWSLVEGYFRNLVDHHQTVIYTPLFTPPLDTEKRDLQLVEVRQPAPGRYQFGWGKLLRWLKLADRCGFQYFEMSHLFSQWGAAYAIRILVQHADGKIKPLCPPRTPATGSVYRCFLEQFLPALLRLLHKHRYFRRCRFHLSDEPHGEQHLRQYRAVREMVRTIAPEMKITEALSEYEFFRHGLVDEPVPVLNKLPDFLEHGIHPMTYYCCYPRGRYPSRFLDYPLYRNRALGLMLYRFQVRGFLHWGCNYWYRCQTKRMIDPYQVNDAHNWPVWTPGDPFVLYPGEDGPVDSIRWEVFREMLDDYRLLCAAEARAGRDKVMALLKPIVQPDRFPQNADFIRKVRAAAAKLALT